MRLQNIERDFISGVLSEEELGNTIHVFEIEDGFACRVHDLHSYEAVSQAVLQRWSFPFALDNWCFGLYGAHSESRYNIERHNCYRQVPRLQCLLHDCLLTMHTPCTEGTLQVAIRAH